jgi:methyl-accepting chemotaxis protein
LRQAKPKKRKSVILNNLKIGVRLAIAFASIVLLLLAISFIAYQRLGLVNTEIENMVEDKAPKTALANDAVDQINVTARALRNALLVKTSEEGQKEIDRLMEARKKTAEIFDKLEKGITSDEGSPLPIRTSPLMPTKRGNATKRSTLLSPRCARPRATT